MFRMKKKKKIPVKLQAVGKKRIKAHSRKKALSTLNFAQHFSRQSVRAVLSSDTLVGFPNVARGNAK